MTAKTKTLPPAQARMIRVDHAGEYGAIRIYQGQRAVFAHTAHTRTTRLIDDMVGHEEEHLTFFSDLIREHKLRPTALLPVWHAAGFALGAVSALISPGAAMACTAAVEEVIDGHYAGQIAELERSDQSVGWKDKLEQFRAEEIAHRNLALREGGRAPAFRLFSDIVAGCTRAAIALSTRL